MLVVLTKVVSLLVYKEELQGLMCCHDLGTGSVSQQATRAMQQLRMALGGMHTFPKQGRCVKQSAWDCRAPKCYGQTVLMPCCQRQSPDLIK